MSDECKHDQGFYLCDTPNDHQFWLIWCCNNRCGFCTPVHPVTQMSYPRKKAQPQKLGPMSKYIA